MTGSIRPFDTGLDATALFGCFAGQKYACLLDSASNLCGLGWFSSGRKYYSVIGANPFLVMKSRGRRITVEQGGRQLSFSGDPFAEAKKLLEKYSVRGKGAPWSCGAIGYFGYGLRHFAEKLPQHAADDTGLPDCVLCFYDPLIVRDNSTGKTFLCHSGANPRPEKAVGEIYAAVGSPAAVNAAYPSASRLECNFTKTEYLRAVARAKEYIAAGDIFQVNISQRFSARFSGDAFGLFRSLREVSPAPFMACLNLGGFSVISSSPERFLKLSGRSVLTRPMKGTRPRGRTAREDEKLRRQLLESAKDRAELVMIVDLMRNDLGRVCSYGTIKVEDLRMIERHPTVFQTTAEVTGMLEGRRGAMDLLKACFPGGSITGCPKIRSMEIIGELEPTERSVYTGALGMLGFDGDADLSMVIRTALVKGDRVYFQVGGGIVADSDPGLEYRETLIKARGIMQALTCRAAR